MPTTQPVPRPARVPGMPAKAPKPVGLLSTGAAHRILNGGASNDEARLVIAGPVLLDACRQVERAMATGTYAEAFDAVRRAIAIASPRE